MKPQDASGNTIADLSLLIAKDFPEFEQIALDDWRKVCILREWTYKHARRALSRASLLDADNSFNYYSKSAPEIFGAFENELGGVWCGGTAYALMTLYNYFGFTSHCIDMGIPPSIDFPGMTHVVTLVEIKQAEQIILSVQDAYFDISYIDGVSGQPLDYFEILARLAKHQHTQIGFAGKAPGIHGEVPALIEPGGEAPFDISWSLDKDHYVQHEMPTGLLKQSIEFTFELFVQRYINIAAFRDLLIKRGYPAEVIYLFHFPFAIYGNHPNAEQVFWQALSVISSHQPTKPELPRISVPRVSVITPCYNSVAFIDSCIQSVLAQTYPNVEHIIQDGASTDGTVELLQKYGDRIDWVSEPDKGQSDGLDRAIKRSTGDILLVLNADDILLPQAAAWAVGAMKSRPEAGVVYGDVYLINEAGSVFGEFHAPEYDFESVLCVEKVIPAQAAFIRRSALEAVGLGADSTLNTCPDYEMFVRLGLKFPMAYVPSFVTKYRQYPRLMDGDAPRTVERFIASKSLVMDRVFEAADTPAEIKQLRRRAYSGLHLWASQEARGMQQIELAWTYFAEALKYYWGWGALASRAILVALSIYRWQHNRRKVRPINRTAPSRKYLVWVGAGLWNATVRNLFVQGRFAKLIGRLGLPLAKIGLLIFFAVFTMAFLYLVYLVWLLVKS